MAFMQSSGSIALSQLQSVMGGANPISMNEYYRGGAYVPSSKTVSTVVRQPSSGEYYNSPYASAGAYGTQWVDADYGTDVYIGWFDSAIANPTYIGSATSVSIGGWTYYRGSYRAYKDIYENYPSRVYAIYRQQGSSYQQSINTNVPSSGQISMSQFYGAEKP